MLHAFRNREDIDFEDAPIMHDALATVTIQGLSPSKGTRYLQHKGIICKCSVRVLQAELISVKITK